MVGQPADFVVRYERNVSTIPSDLVRRLWKVDMCHPETGMSTDNLLEKCTIRYICLNCGDTGWVDTGKLIDPCHLCNAVSWGHWAQKVTERP